MKAKRKNLFWFVAFFTLVFVLALGTAGAEELKRTGAFIDVPPRGPLAASLNLLAAKGIVNGFPDGTFRPQEGLTRAQAAKLLALAAGMDTAAAAGRQSFSDVGTGHWAYGAVEAAAQAGIFRGYPDGTFRPEDRVTRAEAVTLLLRLAGGELDAGGMQIADVPPDHWAYRQVVTAVKAGLTELDQGAFLPELPARRGEMARGLAGVFAVGPRLRTGELAGRLVVKEGRVEVQRTGGGPVEAVNGMKVTAGTKLVTGPQSRAEIVFDDGSGILLDENTALEVTGARGLNFARSDGTWGLAVDRLELKLPSGRIFGSLASRYEAQDRQEKGAAGYGALLASLGVPPGLEGSILAQAEGEETGELPWWAEPYSERERVVVDMPWGVAGIRGTFWMNEVSSRGQRTSLITGKAVVAAAGQAVALTAGQSAVIAREGAAPSAPSALTPEEKRAWQDVKEWVNERASEIQQNLPQTPAPAVLPPQVPVEEAPAQPAVKQGTQEQEQAVQPVTISEVITKALEEATKDAGMPAPAPRPSSGGGGGSSYKPSSNAYLSGLSISVGAGESGGLCPLSPAFNQDTVQYAVYVASEVTGVQVTAVLADTKAALKINGQEAGSGQPVTVELGVPGSATEVAIEVTAEDKAKKRTYTVVVYRAPVEGAGGEPGQPQEPADTSGPVVERTLPSYGAVVDMSPTIVFYFNEIVIEKVYAENIEWKDLSGDNIDLHIKIDVYNVNDEVSSYGVLELTPYDLVHGNSYEIIIGEGTVCDLAGNPNAQYKFEFTVRDWVHETIDDGVAVDYTSLALGEDENGEVCAVMSYTGAGGSIKVAYRPESSGVPTQEVIVPTVNEQAYCKKSSLWLVGGEPWLTFIEYGKGEAEFQKLTFAQKDGGTWQVETVDENARVSDAALAVDSSGAPHIAYYDMCSGEVRHAVRSGSSWDIETVAVGVYQSWLGDGYWAEQRNRTLSLALGEDGTPHIAFYAVQTAGGTLWHACKKESGWQLEEIRLDGSQNYGLCPVVFVTGDKLYFSFYDESNDCLKLVERGLTDTSGSLAQVDVQLYGGLDSSLAVDSWGRPHLSYEGYDNTASPRIWYARRSESAGNSWWLKQPIYDSWGDFTSIALDAKYQNPYIVFVAPSSEGFKLVYAR